jgi:hypothetical protein
MKFVAVLEASPPSHESFLTHPTHPIPSKPSRLESAMNRFVSRLVFSCRDMSPLSSQALDTRLPWASRFRMRLHYLMCAWCRRYAKQPAFLRRAVPRLDDDASESAPPLPTEARGRIRKNLFNLGES